MSPNISPTEKQDRSPKSLLDTDIKVDEVLMESLSVSSTSSSLATSKSSDMSSEGNSFQSVRDRAQRMAATPARPPSSYGHSQPFSIPMPAPKFSDTTSSWRPEPLGGTPLNMFGVIGEPPRSTPLPIGTPAHISRGYETPMRSTPTQDYRDYQRYNATSTSAHESFSSQSHNEPQLANFHRGPITISQMLLDTRYTYGIQRSDGTFTRLIPADQLPKIQGLPQSQQSSEGMIVIPAPRAVSPLSRARGDGQPTQWQQMSSAIGSNRPGPAYDPIQTTIDDIVAMSPPKDSNSRKKKIYCDKWIHDGSCAFTQQGCKFKHEMPMDKQTQRELGLFNGLPQWYKRQQAVELRTLGGSSGSRDGQSTTSAGNSAGSSPLSQPRSGVWRGVRSGPSATDGTRDSSLDSRSKNQYEALYDVEQ